MALYQGTVDGCFRSDIVGINLAQLHMGLIAGKLDQKRLVRLRAHDGMSVVGHIGDGRADEHVLTQQRNRQLEVNLAVDLMKSDKATHYLVLLVEQFLVLSFLGYRIGNSSLLFFFQKANEGAMHPQSLRGKAPS